MRDLKLFTSFTFSSHPSQETCHCTNCVSNKILRSSSDVELSSRFHDTFMFRISASTNSVRVRVVIEDRDDSIQWKVASDGSSSSALQCAGNFYKYQFGFEGHISSILETNDIPIVKESNKEISDWFPLSFASQSQSGVTSSVGSDLQSGKYTNTRTSLWSKKVCGEVN